jgi:alpha-L-fucosidase
MRILITLLVGMSFVDVTLPAQSSQNHDNSPANISSAKEEHDVIGVNENKQQVLHPNTNPDAQWFGQPQFGLFLHWGLSTVENYYDLSWPMIPGRILAQKRITDPAERERIIREGDYNLNGQPPLVTPNEYWKAVEKFNPQHYDPDKWIAAAKEAGFTYAVLVTRHHEGFALWPSAFGDFNTKNYMGGRDLVKPFVEACRKYGLKVGLYYSPPDWHFDREYMNFLYYGVAKTNPEFPSLDADLKPRQSAPDPAKLAAHQQAYSAMIRGQVEELLTRYGKIDLLWFDGCPAGLQGDKVISLERIRELQPGIVINPRLHGHADFKTYENKLTASKPETNWAEFCTSWAAGWTYTTRPFTSDAIILNQLARCRSLNVNYLLGIGPDKDGELHPDAYKNMAVVAAWMKTNGESVRETRSLPAGETASVPAVAKGTTRYLFVSPEFKQEGTGGRMDKSRLDENMLPLTDVTLTLEGVSNPSAVKLLGDGNLLSNSYNADNHILTVSVPATRRTRLMDVVRVEL